MGHQVSFPTEMGIETTGILVVMVTAATLEEASSISDQLVRSRLAACATIIPKVHSTYWWEGKLMTDQEAMIFLKTTSEKFQALQEAVQEMHSYKVPEIIAMPVSKGMPQYIEWVLRETR
jgi:periplasmic divalent cation tolerance protein